jgi:hypothetical protein
MRAFVVLAALLCAPLHVLAQCPPQLVPPDLRDPCPHRYPSWTGELAVLGGNMLLSGVSAGVLHRLKGGSFGDAFLRGAAGGAVVYGGKRIAVERFGGAGLVGRQVAAVGSSMVRNAGVGLGALEQVVLPVGPVRLYLQQAAPYVRPRLDLYSTGWLVYALTEPELRFDAVMSLSAGAPVFLTKNRIFRIDADTAIAHGIAEAGVILLIDVPAYGRDFARQLFEHERVHLLQMDQVFTYVTGPSEERVLAATPGLRRIAPYIDVNLSGALLRVLNGMIPEFLDRPWETEAIFLSR